MARGAELGWRDRPLPTIEAGFATVAINWSGLADELARLGRRREARRLFERDLHNGRNLERAVSGLVARALLKGSGAGRRNGEAVARGCSVGFGHPRTGAFPVSRRVWEEAGPWLTKLLPRRRRPETPLSSEPCAAAPGPDWLKPSTIDPSTGRQPRGSRSRERALHLRDRYRRNVQPALPDLSGRQLACPQARLHGSRPLHLDHRQDRPGMSVPAPAHQPLQLGRTAAAPTRRR